MTPSDHRRALAHQVAQAHEPLAPGRLLALVSGSVVEDLADDRSDIDMCIAFDALPDEAALRGACSAAGGEAWHWSVGALADGELVVAFRLDGIETQIAYTDRATLARDLDEVLVRHNPDTPLHKLAEGLAKAEPLAGADELRGIQARIADFPPPLARAMAAHFIGRVTPWRAIGQLLHRDAGLWCRELQLACAWRLVGALAGLNSRYFTTFQFKRVGRFTAGLADAPPQLAERLDAALTLPQADAFAALHALEADVIDRLQRRWPDLDLDAVQKRHATFVPAAG